MANGKGNYGKSILANETEPKKIIEHFKITHILWEFIDFEIIKTQFAEKCVSEFSQFFHENLFY